jgi:hypothetical protein
MKFSLGGSLGKMFSGFSGKFNKSESFLGKFGRGLTTNLGQTRDYLATQGGGTIGEQLLHRPMREGELQTDWSKGLSNLDRSTMGWSRQLSPLWEGGLSGTGGTLHQDLLPWMEETGMKASHHLRGTQIPGYGSAGKGGGGSSGEAVVASESEDPSLINQGNWQAANTIDSFLRRENMLNRGGLATDLTKTQRGRQSTANLS